MANYIVHKNNNITLVKGDTFDFNLFIEEDELLSETGEEYYSLQDDDVLYFRVMVPNTGWNQAVIEKEYDKYDMQEELGVSYIQVRLEREDTICLPAGTFYYEVKLHRLKYESSEGSESSEIEPVIDKWITIIQKTKMILVD